MATDLPDTPESREESYLADIAGQDVELPEKPLSRKEQYLAYIAENGGGGGGGTSNFNQLSNRPKYNGATMTGDTSIPEVKTYTAGSNVSISDGNVISATDTTYSDFTGTDGTAAGTSGLVPAPATTDAGKFLKADGTWDTAGGGGGGDSVYSTKTTSNSSTGGAVYIGNLGTDQTPVLDPSPNDNHYKYFWALPYSNNGTTYGQPGEGTVNILGSAKGNYSVAIGNSAGSRSYGCQFATMIGPDASIGNYGVAIGNRAGTNQDSQGNVCIGDNAGTTVYNIDNSVAIGRDAKASRSGEVNVGANNTSHGYNSTNYRVIGGVHDPVNAHDAATKNYVDSIVINYATLTAAGAPTTSTAATSVGQLYYDSTNDDYYYCSAIDTTDPNNPVYTWSALSTGGGGPTVVQTTGTSTTNVMSQDATTKLVYPDIANYPYKQVIGEGNIEGTNKGLAINGILNTGITSGSIAIGATDSSLAQIGQNGRADLSLAVGNGAGVGRGMQSIAIGTQAFANSGQNTGDNVAIGYNSYAGNGTATSTVALGAYAKTTRTGEVNIGTGTNGTGYNSTNYRVLGGVYDGQLAQDAVTVSQVNATIDAINTALSTNIPHIGAAS